RALSEELGQTEPGFRNQKNYEIWPMPFQELGPKPSNKWPEFDALFNRHMHICHISRKLFHRNGYVEESKSGRKIYFKWRRLY
ncbi:MAG: hypothetical protein NTZ38_02320, partial [Candidatus Taylorbacteria bacterium]|nr:hypothetical protein [Candidatus Taylorbacteria bacterium]